MMNVLIENLIRLESYKATEALPSSLSVLVADDEPLMVELISRTLKSLGHEIVATADNGETGVQLARKHRPDLIILDLMMPELDGIQAAQQILAEMSVPIILSTGCTNEATLQRVKKANIQFYLVKPFHKEQLKSAVTMAIMHHQAKLASEAKIAALQNELEVVKTVDRAASLLMEKFRIDRKEALEKLEAAARARTCSLLDAARAIVVTLSPIMPEELAAVAC
jgi:AmiR/NasT family two-component response regulator